MASAEFKNSPSCSKRSAPGSSRNQPGRNWSRFYLFSFRSFQRKNHLPADELYSFEDGRLISSKGTPVEETLVGSILKKNTPVPYYSTNTSTHGVKYHRAIQKVVSKCIDEIVRGNFEKIVPSRSKTVELPPDFDIVDTFTRLCSLYPQAMVSIFSSPVTGTWVGATPEMLVGISRDRHFRTVAVAGTQSYEEGIDLRSISWTQKKLKSRPLLNGILSAALKK